MFGSSFSKPMAKVRTKKLLADMEPPVRPAERQSLDLSAAAGSFVPAKHTLDDIPSIPFYNHRSGKIGRRPRSRRRVVSMPVFSREEPEPPATAATEASNRSSWPHSVPTTKPLPPSPGLRLSGAVPSQEKSVTSGYDSVHAVTARVTAPGLASKAAKSNVQPMIPPVAPEYSRPWSAVPEAAPSTKKTDFKYVNSRVVSAPQFPSALVSSQPNAEASASAKVTDPQIRRSAIVPMDKTTIARLKIMPRFTGAEFSQNSQPLRSSEIAPSVPNPAPLASPKLVPTPKSTPWSPPARHPKPNFASSLPSVAYSGRSHPPSPPPHFSQPNPDLVYQPHSQPTYLNTSLNDSVIKIFETYLTLGSRQSFSSEGSSSDASSAPSAVNSGALDLTNDAASASSIYSDVDDLPLIECDSLFDKLPADQKSSPVKTDRRLVSESTGLDEPFQYCLDMGADYSTSRFMIPESQRVQKSPNVFSPLNRKFSQAYLSYRNKSLPASPTKEELLAAHRKEEKERLEENSSRQNHSSTRRVASGPVYQVKTVSTDKHDIWFHQRKQKPQYRAASGPVYQVKSFVR